MNYFHPTSEVSKGKIGYPWEVYPSSCSQHIAPDSPLQPVYNRYIGGICWYISRVLSLGYPTLPFDKYLLGHWGNIPRFDVFFSFSVAAQHTPTHTMGS